MLLYAHVHVFRSCSLELANHLLREQLDDAMTANQSLASELSDATTANQNLAAELSDARQQFSDKQAQYTRQEQVCTALRVCVCVSVCHT